MVPTSRFSAVASCRKSQCRAALRNKISGIYLSSLDDEQQKLVLLCHSSFGYDSGHLYYACGQKQLTSVLFDPADGHISGNSAPIAGGVGFQPSTYWAALAVSGNGTVIYLGGWRSLVGTHMGGPRGRGSGPHRRSRH
jgi:hypothetical protein